MESSWDFIQWLGPDMSMQILMCLDDPSDLARVCSVSSSWQQFVIAHGLSKHLCLRMFPEVSNISHVIEVNNTIEPVEASPENLSKWEILKRDHRVYAFLSRGLTSFVKKDCISESINASSTDNYPEESIENTLEPRDRVEERASYWSSEGESDPSAPEILVYKLISKLCVISEIHVQPFQAYFQFGFPIYSAKAVRFRMGHSKPLNEVESDARDDNDFVWTYTSPVFPMAQENCMQNFKLPEPVLCIGGILAVELLGRVQRQEMDGLYYICVSHVQVFGRSLSPSFDVEVLDISGSCTLKYDPSAEYCFFQATSPSQCETPPSTFSAFGGRIRMWEQMFLNTFLGNGAEVDDNDDEDNEDYYYE